MTKLTKAWILLGIPILFIVGGLLHFAYEWSNENVLVAIFAPVNESVWEHLKMAFWPTLIWWLIGYYRFRKSTKFSTDGWFVSCAAALIIGPLVISTFYYTYTGAFGIESLALDIFSLLLGIALAQCLALHLYTYTDAKKQDLYCALAIILLMVLAFTLFTFMPPHYPLFMDSSTGQYGISN